MFTKMSSCWKQYKLNDVLMNCFCSKHIFTFQFMASESSLLHKWHPAYQTSSSGIPLKKDWHPAYQKGGGFTLIYVFILSGWQWYWRGTKIRLHLTLVVLLYTPPFYQFINQDLPPPALWTLICCFCDLGDKSFHFLSPFFSTNLPVEHNCRFGFI